MVDNFDTAKLVCALDLWEYLAAATSHHIIERFEKLGKTILLSATANISSRGISINSGRSYRGHVLPHESAMSSYELIECYFERAEYSRGVLPDAGINAFVVRLATTLLCISAERNRR